MKNFAKAHIFRIFFYFCVLFIFWKIFMHEIYEGLSYKEWFTIIFNQNYPIFLILFFIVILLILSLRENWKTRIFFFLGSVIILYISINIHIIQYEKQITAFHILAWEFWSGPLQMSTWLQEAFLSLKANDTGRKMFLFLGIFLSPIIIGIIYGIILFFSYLAKIIKRIFQKFFPNKNHNS